MSTVLKQQIMAAADSNDFGLLFADIGPITAHIAFRANVADIVATLIKDRNGDGKFTPDDITLIGKDIIAMTNLVTSVVLIVNSVPNIALTYDRATAIRDAAAVADIVVKIILYILVVVVPQQTHTVFTREERLAIVNTAIVLYDFLLNSQVIKSIVSNVEAWLKQTGWCKCICGAPDKQAQVDEHMPAVLSKLDASLNNAKDKENIINAIEILSKQHADLMNNKSKEII